MAIKILSDKIEIGNFTLVEKPSSLSGLNTFAAEKRYGSLSFNGQLSFSSVFSIESQAITGSFSGGHINPLGTSWVGIDKFPFATISNAKSVSTLFQSRSYASGASSRTNAYTFGGNSGTITPYLLPTNSNSVNTVDRFPFSNDLNAKFIGNLAAGPRSLSSGQSSPINGYCTGGVGSFNSPTNTNFISPVEKISFFTDTPTIQVASLITPGYGRTGFSSSINGYYSTTNSPTALMRFGTNGAGGISENNGKFSFANDTETNNISTFISQLPTVTTGASAPDAGYYVTSYMVPGYTTSFPGYIPQSPVINLRQLARLAKFPFSSEITILNVGHLYGAHPSTHIGQNIILSPGAPLYPGFTIPSTYEYIKTDFNHIACSSGDTKAVLGGGSLGDDGTSWTATSHTPNVYYRLNRMDTFPFSTNSFCTYVGDLATGRSGMVGHSDK